jgi:hypothetical protein
LFYLSLLNSPITKIILEKNLKQENEKDYFIPLRAIKEFVRIPKITDDNQRIKKEVIKQIEKFLVAGDGKLSDFVDFAKVLIQKFDDVYIEDSYLVLEKDKGKIKILIKNNKNLIKKIIAEKYGSKELKLEKQKINLEELKTLPIIDFEKQKQLKDYIDDLVFTLYFNIPLKQLGLNNANIIKELCSKNTHYKVISEG